MHEIAKAVQCCNYEWNNLTVSMNPLKMPAVLQDEAPEEMRRGTFEPLSVAV